MLKESFIFFPPLPTPQPSAQQQETKQNQKKRGTKSNLCFTLLHVASRCCRCVILNKKLFTHQRWRPGDSSSSPSSSSRSCASLVRVAMWYGSAHCRCRAPNWSRVFCLFRIQLKQQFLVLAVAMQSEIVVSIVYNAQNIEYHQHHHRHQQQQQHHYAMVAIATRRPRCD